MVRRWKVEGEMVGGEAVDGIGLERREENLTRKTENPHLRRGKNHHGEGGPSDLATPSDIAQAEWEKPSSRKQERNSDITCDELRQKMGLLPWE